MPRVQQRDLFNGSMLVINKHFQVVAAQHIQIDLVSVISNSHYKRSLLIQSFDFGIQRKPFELSPRNHA